MRKSAPRVHRLDGCGADSYEPAALVFNALDQLKPGEQLCLLIDSEPFALYRQLSNKAYAYCTRVLEHALYEVTIWHCGARPAQLPGQLPARRGRFALLG